MHKPVIAKPNRIETLSCNLVFLGSHTAQQNPIKIDVATYSMQNALKSEMIGCGFVTQNDGTELFIISIGVRAINNPYPMYPPIICAMIYQGTSFKRNEKLTFKGKYQTRSKVLLEHEQFSLLEILP